MQLARRGWAATSALVMMTVLVAGCDTLGTAEGVTGNTLPQPNSLPPVQNSNVSTTPLPPIGGGEDAAPPPGSVNPSLTGTPVMGGVQANAAPGANGGFVSLNDMSTTPTGPHDLSGGLSVATLAGGWNVAANNVTCRLNLTNTAKAGTTRFRASMPGCQINSLAGVASWTLVGSQIQLFDEAGSMVAGLLRSGDRFIGTAAGGSSLTMTA